MNFPKTIQDGGNSMTLQAVDWQTEGDGHFTAMASYTGSATTVSYTHLSRPRQNF